MSKQASLVEPPLPSRLTVKFLDELKVRASNGTVISLVSADLSAVLAVKDQYGLTFAPSTDTPQTTLDFIESRAAQMSGIAQPDLGGILDVSGPAETLTAAANALLALGNTEFVEFTEIDPDPPCIDLGSPTPQLFDTPYYYAYHAADPGMNMLCAWEYGGRGSDVQVTDCEYGFRLTTVESDPIHEDLCDIETADNATCLHVGGNALYIAHGLATLGVLGALDNEYGWTGLVPDAQLRFASEWSGCGHTRTGAIYTATAASQPGDVILLEMQDNYQNTGFVPAEVRNGVWLASRLAGESGIIVVAAAGNGNRTTGQGRNLDTLQYATYMGFGDSFAIIVGAGTPDMAHDRVAFSTYGSRVNVQAAGYDVLTTNGLFLNCVGPSYNDGTEIGSYFCHSGTSSASVMVAGAAASIQSMLASRGLPKLTPLQMRQLLVNSGIPQGSATAAQHIGPFPNLGEAILQLGLGYDLNQNQIPDCCDGTYTMAVRACCFEDGTCLTATGCACELLGGSPGVQSSCSGVGCPIPNAPQWEP